MLILLVEPHLVAHLIDVLHVVLPHLGYRPLGVREPLLNDAGLTVVRAR